MDEFNYFLPWTPTRLSRIDSAQLQTLVSPSQSIHQDLSEPITNLAVFLSAKQRKHFAVSTYSGRAALLHWYKTQAFSIYNLDSFFSCLNGDYRMADNVPEDQGFNLIGYGRGRLGLGEDLRAVATYLRTHGIPFSIFTIGHPSNAVDEYKCIEESNELKFNTSLFFLNAMEAERFINIFNQDLSLFGYKIICPPWELSKAPAQWQSTFAHFHEVWCMSRFVLEAYQSLHPKLVAFSPVIPAPADATDKVPRQERAFTYLYIFDAGSYLTRKNPEAVVLSFLQAFGQTKEPVRLILKVSNWMVSDATNYLAELVKKDSRITLVTTNYSQQQMERLWQTCSCYVSLHRSEGFGRTMAEAAARNIPVVCTGWSGNVDITGMDYPLLVDYELIAVKDNEYPFANEQQWAGVDIDDAAKKLFWVYKNAEKRQLKAIVTELTERFHSCFSVQTRRPEIEELYCTGKTK
ncbi:glycosyltransferase [Alteromonas sp. 14N.309.X.WAT.G.H12]|uniref:glycosyltransferase n=1 Tax=Alteromonas sp. 14N.309.X.WAT.G.H12 TaxID=3120824 RepID=UPI002FD03185